MNMIKKSVLLFLISLLLMMTMILQFKFKAEASGWQHDEKGWWYATNTSASTWYADGWKWIEGEDGIAKQYYFDENGYIYRDTTTPDGYTVDSNGAWTVNGVVQTKHLQDTNDNNAQDISDEGPLSNNTDNNSRTNPVSQTEVISGKSGVSSQGGINSQNNQTNNETSSGNIKEVATDPPGTSFSSEIENMNGGITVSSNNNTVLDENDWESYTRSNITGQRTEGSKSLARSEPTELVSFARQFVNSLPYVYGGTSLQSGTDCSGFVYAVYQHFGMNVPRSSAALYNASTPISGNELKAGDLVFYFKPGASTPHHVGIYTGDGTIIHNTMTGDFVREMDALYYPRYAFGRIIS